MKLKHRSPVITVIALWGLPFFVLACRTRFINEQYVTKQYREAFAQYAAAISGTNETLASSIYRGALASSHYGSKSPTNTKIIATIMGRNSLFRSTPFMHWQRHNPPYTVIVNVYVFDATFKTAILHSASIQTSSGETTALSTRAGAEPFKEPLEPQKFKAEYPDMTPRESLVMLEYDKPLPYEINSTAILDVNLSLIKSDGTEDSWTSSWTFVPFHQEESSSWLSLILLRIFCPRM